MSSFFAHGLVGVGLGVRLSWVWRLAIVFFACLPDIEYLPYWLFSIELNPRWTHSIGFVAAVWLLTLATLRACRITTPKRFEALLLLAGISHLLMDYAVGVHPNPIFAPLLMEVFASPVGILPSAGSLDPTNFYLWRNLMIEVGILGPLLWLGYKGSREKGVFLRIVIALAVALPFLIWSLSLGR